MGAGILLLIGAAGAGAYALGKMHSHKSGITPIVDERLLGGQRNSSADSNPQDELSDLGAEVGSVDAADHSNGPGAGGVHGVMSPTGPTPTDTPVHDTGNPRIGGATIGPSSTDTPVESMPRFKVISSARSYYGDDAKMTTKQTDQAYASGHAASLGILW